MNVDIGVYPRHGDRKVSVKISTSDTYFLGHTLALVIHPALKKFREHSIYVWPANLGSVIEWLDILDKIIFAFECIVKEQENQHQEKVQEGLQLFAKYYQHLWW